MKRFVCLVVFAVMLAAIPAGASTFLAVSRGELVAQSDAIVQGSVGPAARRTIELPCPFPGQVECRVVMVATRPSGRRADGRSS